MFTFARDAFATVLREAGQAAPEECCGLLLGHGEAIGEAMPAANVASDPARFFEIDPAALIAAHKNARDGGLQVVGYYHSHPTGNAVPSAVDRARASGDGCVWAIVAGRSVTLWRDGKRGFEPVCYSVHDD